MRLFRYAIENPQFSLVVFLAFLVLGAGAMMNMPFSEDPPLDPPGVTVIAFYPGTAPVDMERLIVEPLETAINEIEGIKRLQTRIEEGLTKLSIEFDGDADSDDKYREVQQKVNQSRKALPADLEELEVIQWSTTNVCILQLALVGDDYGYRDLYEEARRLKRALERLGGVKKIELHGYPDEIVRVDLEPDRLAPYRLSPEQVAAVIHDYAGNLPGGTVDAGSRRFNVRTTTAYNSLQDLRNTVLTAPDGRFLRLGEVARVDFGHEDEVYRTRYNGRRCVFVAIYQKENSDLLAITRQVREKLPALTADLPPGMRLEIGFEQAVGVSGRLVNFASNLVQGIALVGISILVVLGFRSSVVVMAAIPASFLIGISFVYLTGYGIHQMTITGMIIALGLLVDNAVVVTENTVRLQETGLSRRQAALAGVSQIVWPLVTSTLTTVLAFVPIVFIKDSTGDFVRSMPVTVIYTMLASLGIVLTLLPLLASRLLPEQQRQNRLQRYLRLWVERWYQPVLAWCLRHRPAFLGLVVLVFVGSLALFPLVGVSFFPKAEKPQFMVDVNLPRGTNLEATDQATRYVEQVLAQQPEVARYLTNVGKGNPVVYYNMSYTEPKPYYAQVFVQVDESRGRNTGQLVADLRTLFADFPAGEIKVWEFMQGPNTDAPVVIRIFGENLTTLAQLAGEAEQLVRATPGAIYVNNPLQVSGTGLAVDLQRDKAQLLGLTPGAVDRAVRASLAGLPAARYRDANGKEYAIVLRLPLNGPPTPHDFERIRLTTPTGGQVPLSQVAEVRLQARQAVIQHYRLERMAVIYADAAGCSVDDVTRDVVRALEGYRWPAGYRYAMGGELESREESFGSLGQAVLIALVSMFGILVLEFRSLGQPFVIFVAIPLAVIGSILALLLTGYSFSFTAFLGVTSLVGIVVNNSILLVDTANQKRLEGSPTEAAVLVAGVSRFMPVTLTSVTTIVGLLPLALTGDTMWAPMSWAIMGGLLTSTLLTLLVVPALYLIFTPRLIPAAETRDPAGEMPR